MSEDIRKLITLATISEIIPTPLESEFITGYKVRGWVVVDSKGKYQVGDTVLYIEPDAFLPAGVEQWDFLVEKSSKTVPFEGQDVLGHVLKIIKLRGQVSQGLILPLGFGLTKDSTQAEINEVFQKLGVFKYEPPLPAGGAQIAAFPTKFARKTDSERVQNVTEEFLQSLNPEDWIATEKIDGMSSTFWKVDGELHAAGRNWELSLEGGNAHSQIVKKYDLETRIPEGGVLQAEIFGEGIQGNPLKVQGIRLAIFSTGVIAGAEIASEELVEFETWADEFRAPQVPLEFPKSVDEAIAQVDGMKSLITPSALAEGVVWWNRNGESFAELGDRPNFKAINQKFLLKLG